MAKFWRNLKKENKDLQTFYFIWFQVRKITSWLKWLLLWKPHFEGEYGFNRPFSDGRFCKIIIIDCEKYLDITPFFSLFRHVPSLYIKKNVDFVDLRSHSSIQKCSSREQFSVVRLHFFPLPSKQGNRRASISTQSWTFPFFFHSEDARNNSPHMTSLQAVCTSCSLIE